MDPEPSDEDLPSSHDSSLDEDDKDGLGSDTESDAEEKPCARDEQGDEDDTSSSSSSEKESDTTASESEVDLALEPFPPLTVTGQASVPSLPPSIVPPPAITPLPTTIPLTPSRYVPSHSLSVGTASQAFPPSAQSFVLPPPVAVLPRYASPSTQSYLPPPVAPSQSHIPPAQSYLPPPVTPSAQSYLPPPVAPSQSYIPPVAPSQSYTPPAQTYLPAPTATPSRYALPPTPPYPGTAPSGRSWREILVPSEGESPDVHTFRLAVGERFATIRIQGQPLPDATIATLAALYVNRSQYRSTFPPETEAYLNAMVGLLQTPS